MDSFQRGEIVRILPCGHVFHKDECDEWLLKWRKLVSHTSPVPRLHRSRSAFSGQTQLRAITDSLGSAQHAEPT